MRSASCASRTRTPFNKGTLALDYYHVIDQVINVASYSRSSDGRTKYLTPSSSLGLPYSAAIKAIGAQSPRSGILTEDTPCSHPSQGLKVSPTPSSSLGLPYSAAIKTIGALSPLSGILTKDTPCSHTSQGHKVSADGAPLFSPTMIPLRVLRGSHSRVLGGSLHLTRGYPLKGCHVGVHWTNDTE